MSLDLERLQARLGYVFDDQGLLEQALSHRSSNRKKNYERLEFLGDACLDLIISEQLYQLFPDASEGQLTRMRASLVQGKTLALIATQLDLGPCLFLGSGEMKSGGFRRESILADVLESILGAIYLESGLEAAQQFVLTHWQQRLQDISPDMVEKDPKTRLQEYLQGHKLPLPVYSVLSVKGMAPKEEFTVVCELQHQQFQSVGGSRRKAEQLAASQALKWLEANHV